jgi:5-methylcytosine-specific restriction enzyme subunit McrC
MNDVFENFVWVALREALGLSKWTFPSGSSNHPLFMDLAQKVLLRPDLSWWQDSKCMFVGDVKYKRINVPGIKHADLYPAPRLCDSSRAARRIAYLRCW